MKQVNSCRRSFLHCLKLVPTVINLCDIVTLISNDIHQQGLKLWDSELLVLN